MRSNKVGERPTKIQSSTKQTSLGFEHPSFPMPPFLPSLFYKNFRNIFVQQKDENLKKPKLNYVFFQEQNADSAEKISPITLCTIFQPKKSNLVGFKKKPLQLVKRETQKTLKRDDHGLAITL